MASYQLITHFRGDPADRVGSRCQFRRYVAEIHLTGEASCGTLTLRHDAGVLYYLGHVPVDGVTLSVCAHTQRTTLDGGVQDFKTPEIALEWHADAPVSGRIARLMLCFSHWGMSYSAIEAHTPDELLAPAEAFIDGKPASAAPNDYRGVVMPDAPEPVTLPAVTDTGKLLSRFAVIADAHVGIRYEWENYDWLHTAFDKLAEIHAETPLDFVVQLGDNIDDGYAKSYETDYAIYLEEIKHLRICDPVHPLEGRAPGMIPHYEMQGNHDTSMDTRFFRTKLWYTDNPDGKVAYISFFTSYGGYPLVWYESVGNYDSYRSYGVISDEMVDFVDKSVADAKENGAKHIILLCHFGISQEVGAPILPETGLGKIAVLCKKHDIRLYFNGHEHEESFPLRFFDGIYDYDVSMLRQKFGVAEIFEHACRLTVYNTDDGKPVRTDLIPL